MSEGSPKETEKKRYATRKYPKDTLMDSLRIAKSIHDNNADQPYDRLDLAKSIEYSPDSSVFRSLLISSRRFGLTTGGYRAEKIALTELGKSIVAPRNDQERVEGIKQSLYNIDLYRKFFSQFDGRRLPKKDFIKNTLNRDFEIPVQDTDECFDMLIKNAKELGIITEIKDTEYIKMSELVPSVLIEIEEGEIEEELEEDLEEVSEEPKPEKVAPRVFISHSKNKKIVDQIKQILDFGQFDYRIAEERETTAIPISDKIFGLMRECNSAIINVSADEQEKKEDGTYGINQNVLIEIGAGFLSYNKKVILLVDKRVKLPSNLQGLYRCDYEGDELTFNIAMKLQKTLTEFRKP